MKQLFLLLFACLLTLSLQAQTPLGINYQAVARDGDGALLREQSVGVTFLLRPVSGGNNVYAETHNLTTNNYGIFTTIIGQGTVIAGDFSTVDWSVAYELGVQVNGTDLGFIAFQSVPYALNTAPRREVVSIPGALFTANNNTALFRNSIGNGGSSVTSTNGATVTTVLNAPLQLPHGARIESMTAYFIDESDAQLRIWLAKENFAQGFAIISEVATTGNDSGIRNETRTINENVNNENGGYYLRVFCDNWDAAGSKSIKGVKIVYTY